jgi:hypothetical protein
MTAAALRLGGTMSGTMDAGVARLLVPSPAGRRGLAHGLGEALVGESARAAGPLRPTGHAPAVDVGAMIAKKAERKPPEQRIGTRGRLLGRMLRVPIGICHGAPRVRR